MSKELEALERIQYKYVYIFKARENGKEKLVRDLNTIKKGLKALEIIKDLIYIDVNNQVRLKPKDKTLTATESLDEEKANLLKEVLL